MNKVNFVTGFRPDKPDFDMLQDSLEDGLENVAAAVAGKGIKTGYDITITGTTASASAGIGFDGLGRILIKTDPITADLGTLPRPAAGLYRWVTLALRYKVTEEGQVLDINNQASPAQYLDDVEIEIIDTEADDIAANIIKPALTDYQVPLLDIRIDETSAWEDLVSDAIRKLALISISEMKEYIDNSVQTTKNELYPIGATYIQFPDDDSPSTLGLPGTWANVSSELAGDFIRFEGGAASAFESGQQGLAVYPHGHQQYKADVGFSAGGVIADSANGAPVNLRGGGSGVKEVISDGVYPIPTLSVDQRPVNKTVRKWRRAE